MMQHIWAKSPTKGTAAGETLQTHSLAAQQAAQDITRRVGQLPSHVDPHGTFTAHATVAALLHDAGKVADGFQRQVGNGTRQNDGQHVGQIWGQRHEILSLGIAARVLTDVPLPVAAAIATHHRQLSVLEGQLDGKRAIRQRYRTPDEAARQFTGQTHREDVRQLVTWYQQTLNVNIEPDETPLPQLIRQELDVLYQATNVPRDDGLYLLLVQAALCAADHLSSAHHKLSFHNPLHFQHVRRNVPTPYPHQTQAWDVDGHMLLWAPTGTGKTEALTGWAANNNQTITQTTGGSPRTLYTLPYLAPINAMQQRLEHDLNAPGQVGVLHSNAQQQHYNNAARSDDDSTPAQLAAKTYARNNADRLHTRLLRVTTPYQLTNGIFAGPQHSPALLDCANSTLIFDELHAYDPPRLAMTLGCIRLWEQLGARIAIGSATMPDRLANLIETTLQQPVTRVEASRQQTDKRRRHRWLHHTHDMTEPYVIDTITRQAATQSILIVCNTIRRATRMRELLHQRGQQLTMLHSRYTAEDRNRHENGITTRWSTRNLKRPPGIVIATQVIEVSVDATFDVAYLDMATIDALDQRAGRVNRTNPPGPPADINVHTPHTDNKPDIPTFYPQGNIEATLTELDHLDGTRPTDTQIREHVNNVYNSTWGQQWEQQIVRLRDNFTTSFCDFTRPFEDRTWLHTQFQKQYETTINAVPADLHERYMQTLETDGHLAAANLTIPTPAWVTNHEDTIHDTENGIYIVNAPYDPESGLNLTKLS